MAKPTQDHILISDIKDGIILLKDGSACLVLQTSAVNFGLLSVEEQLAIISAFAQTLNSLSFTIQIVIYSKRLDISSYIKLLDNTLTLQQNPLLSGMVARYKSFVESLIKEREVLDKRFYVAINVSSLELGFGLKGEDRIKKIKAVITPRKDQITRQLSRVGLTATALDDKALILLFYEIYNQGLSQTTQAAPILMQPNLQSPKPVISKPQPIPTPQPPRPPQTTNQPLTTERSRTHPFIVEELADQI